MHKDHERDSKRNKRKEKVIYKKLKGHERHWIGPVAHLEDLNQSTLARFVFKTIAIPGG